MSKRDIGIQVIASDIEYVIGFLMNWNIFLLLND